MSRRKRSSFTAPPPNPVVEGVFLSEHLLERVREHHPRAGVRGGLALLERATEVEPGLVAPLLGRRLESTNSRYLVAYDRRGVFVIEPTPDRPFPWTGVTYLRFGAYQQEVAERLLAAA